MKLAKLFPFLSKNETEAGPANDVVVSRKEADTLAGTDLARTEPVWSGVRGPFHPFESLFSPSLPALFGARVQRFDTGDRVIVRAELPGVEKRDVEVDLRGRDLTIRGAERAPKDAREPATWIGHGAFEYRVRLPADVDRTSGEAKLDKGVLRVCFRREERASPRRIAVR